MMQAATETDERESRPRKRKKLDARLLLVEDSKADIDLVKLAARQSKSDVNLTVIQDGAEALGYLKDLASTDDSVFPHLILLDLRLPGLDGLDSLRAIRSDPVLGQLPVVVFSSSDDPTDIDTAYEVGANAFLQKPVNPLGFINRIELALNFWFTAAALPSGSRAL